MRHPDFRRERRPHLLRRGFEIWAGQHEKELLFGWKLQRDQFQGLVAPDKHEPAHDRRPHVVGVVAGDLLLRFQPGEHQLLRAQPRAEDLVDRDGGRCGARRAGPEPAPQRQALFEGQREADGANPEPPHDLDGGDPGAVPEGVLAELLRVVAGDLGNGDLARVDAGVDARGDVVAEPVDRAAEEVESGAEVGDGGRRKGPDGGEDGLGLGGQELGLGASDDDDDAARSGLAGLVGSGERERGDGLEGRLVADRHRRPAKRVVAGGGGGGGGRAAELVGDLQKRRKSI